MTCNAVPPKGPDGLNQIDILRTQGRESVQVAQGAAFLPAHVTKVTKVLSHSAETGTGEWHAGVMAR